MELAGFEHFSILGGFGTYEVQIALCYALAHFVLRFALKPIWGDKRNSAAVMGGSDGARGDAKFSAKDLAKRSLTIDVVAYNMIAVSYAVYCAVTGPMGWLDGSAANNLGAMLMWQGRPEEAQHWFSRACDLDPADTLARANLRIAARENRGLRPRTAGGRVVR